MTRTRRPTAAFMRPMLPSAALSKVVGHHPLARTEVVKRLFEYITANGLQDARDKRMINADALLRDVFDGKGRVSLFEMTKLVNAHLTDAPESSRKQAEGPIARLGPPTSVPPMSGAALDAAGASGSPAKTHVPAVMPALVGNEERKPASRDRAEEKRLRAHVEELQRELAKLRGVPKATPPPEPPADASQEPEWAHRIDDAGVKRFLVHLSGHGSVSEAEVISFLGSPRAYRRFSLDFESHLTAAPFRVRIEATAEGKRYVKEGEK